MKDTIHRITLQYPHLSEEDEEFIEKSKRQDIMETISKKSSAKLAEFKKTKFEKKLKYKSGSPLKKFKKKGGIKVSLSKLGGY